MTETSEMLQELQKANRAADVRTRLRVEQARREVAAEIVKDIEALGETLAFGDIVLSITVAMADWESIKAKYLGK